MSGGGGAPQTQTVAGTAAGRPTSPPTTPRPPTPSPCRRRTRRGKGAVSAPSAPRRATGKLAAAGSASAPPRPTPAAPAAGHGRLPELTAAERNGSTATEVSYTLQRASTGQSGPVSGRARPSAGSPTAAQRPSPSIANSSVAPSSDASAPATGHPVRVIPAHRRPPVRTAAQNQKNADPELVLAGSPQATTRPTTQIRIDGGGWETGGSLAGSRHHQHRRLQRATPDRVSDVLNSGDTAGPIAARVRQVRAGRKPAGPPASTAGWTAAAPTCPAPLVGRRPGTSPATGRAATTGRGWGPATPSTIMCWKRHGTADSLHSGQTVQWYYIMRGSPNATRWIDSRHTTLGPPPGSGVPQCNFPTGATP